MSDTTNQQVLDAINAVAVKLDQFGKTQDGFAIRLDQSSTKQDQLFMGVADTLQTITDNMTTKDDLKEGFNVLDTKLTAEINAVEYRLKDRMEIMGARLTAKIEENRADSIERYSRTLQLQPTKT